MTQSNFYSTSDDLFREYDKMKDDGKVRSTSQDKFFRFFDEKKQRSKFRSVERLMLEESLESQTRIGMHEQYERAIESGEVEVKHIVVKERVRRRTIQVTEVEREIEFISPEDFVW